MTTYLFRLSARDRARRCLQLATEAEEAANRYIDPKISEAYRRIAEHWKLIAAEAAAEARDEDGPPPDSRQG